MKNNTKETIILLVILLLLILIFNIKSFFKIKEVTKQKQKPIKCFVIDNDTMMYDSLDYITISYFDSLKNHNLIHINFN